MSRRWATARGLLRLCGARDAGEAIRDVREEAIARRTGGHARGRVAVWVARELVTVAWYELRDGDMTRRSKSIFPLLALRLAARNVSRRPAIPLLAALTLALGYGAAGAIFGVYTGFSRPLPVPEGDSVHWLRVLDERGNPVGMTLGDLEALQQGTRAFAELGAYETASVSMRVPAGFPVRLSHAAMTLEVFHLLRAEPLVGRLPVDDDGGRAVLIGHNVWTDYFEADPAVVGETVRIDAVDRVIVGVMHEGHRFPFQQDVWSVIEPGGAGASLEIAGRLGDGITADQAIIDASRVLEARRRAGGETLGLRVRLPAFTEERGEGGESLALATLLGLVICLLLVSCSNVSNLLLGRALVRADSLAVHSAIGAGPAQLVVQMLLEAILIALSGALAGVVIAAGAILYIQSTLHGHWGYYWMRVQFEPAVVLFTLALALATGLLSGMLPALRLGRADLGEILRSNAAGVVGPGRRRMSRWLLNGQVTFSCIALIIAALMAGAMLRSRTASDFRADDVYALSVSFSTEGYEDPERRRALRAALEQSAALDARIGALVASNVLPGLENQGDVPQIEGVAIDPEVGRKRTLVLAVTPGYFELFNLSLLSGRRFESIDGAGERVALVSDAFVHHHLDGGDPIGRRLRLPALAGDEWIRIVGVVANTAAYESAESRAQSRLYLPFAVLEPRSYQLLFTGADRDAAASAVRQALNELDPDLGVSGYFGGRSAVSVEEILRYVRRIYQTVGVLSLMGGVSAALVALIGLYGALTFEVQRSLSEIGLRMAMGATRSDVLRQVTRTGLRSVAPGLALGFLMSAAVAPALGVLRGHMSARDPLIYVGVFLAYVAVATLATLGPGRRAARLDPARVLRSD